MRRRACFAVVTVLALVLAVFVATKPPVSYTKLSLALFNREPNSVILELIDEYSLDQLEEVHNVFWTNYYAHHGLNALGVAAMHGNAVAVRLLAEKGVSPLPACDKCRSPSVMLVRVFAGDVQELADAIDAMIDNGLDVNASDPSNGQTMLHAAFSRPSAPSSDLRADIVRILCNRGSNPDVPDADGVTAREMAQRLGLCKLLDRR